MNRNTLLAAALLLVSTPAYGAVGVYGPPAPAETSFSGEPYEVEVGESLEQGEARFKRDTDSAWRKFWIGQGLAVADVALTCAVLAKGGRELNPIYGKNASCGRIAAIRGGVSALQYFLTRRAIHSDPTGSNKRLKIVLAIQAGPVIWNAIQLTK